MVDNLYNRITTVMLLCLMLSFVNSCAATHPSKTTSRPPEVIVDNVTKKQIIDIIAEEMRGNKFKVYSLTDSMIIVGRKSGQELATFVYGPSFYGIAEERIAYNIIKSGNSVKVTADISLVANPGTSFEKSTSLNETKYAESMQASLNSLMESAQQYSADAHQKQNSTADTGGSPHVGTSGKSQLEMYVSDIKAKSSISAKIRAAAQLCNDGKISKEDRNKLQAAILKGEL